MKYLITPTLLNSWQYLWDYVKYVREGANDTISYEDKCADAYKKAYDEFLNTLNRLPIEQNEAMKRGIEYEDACYKGETQISPMIEGGAFQIVGMKTEIIDGIEFLLYGRLDVLKGGTIIDIKRVNQYTPPKYATSHQHPFYLYLFPNAYEFTYLVCDNYDKIHKETYYKDEVEDIKSVIKNFINWLRANDLLNVYLTKWQSKGGK